MTDRCAFCGKTMDWNASGPPGIEPGRIYWDRVPGEIKRTEQVELHTQALNTLTAEIKELRTEISNLRRYGIPSR